MSNYDTVLSTIKGKTTGESLVSIWRHYPEHDLYLDELVESTVRDYKKYPSDVVKLSPNGRYCVVDFGCKISKGTTEPKATGSTSCKDCIVKKPIDWNKIVEIDPLDGHYGQQIEFVEMISKEIPNVPIMMTIFAPTMVARKLSNNQMVEHYQAENNRELLSALKTIEKVTTEYGRACIDAGANGIFMAIQEADKTHMNSNSEAEKVLQFNTNFAREMNRKAEFTVNHIHGDQIYFEEAIRCVPSDAINWHDRTSNIDILTARKIFKGGLFGGLEPNDLYNGIKADYFTHFKDMLEDVPLILAPGCVVLQQTPEETLELIFDEYKVKS